MRVTFPRVVRAEWTKFVGLRSTWILFALVAVPTIGLAYAIAGNAEVPDPSSAYLGVDVVSLLLGVVGIVMVTGEYGSGLVRATFTAVPARLPMLWAKAVVLAGFALPVMAAVVLLSALTFRLVRGPMPGMLGHAAGAAVAPVLLALLGLGIGGLVRHTAAAITGFILVILVAPTLLGVALPDDWGDRLVKYTPVSAAQALYTEPERLMLHTGPAAWVLSGWVAVALAAGAVMVLRRDP